MALRVYNHFVANNGGFDNIIYAMNMLLQCNVMVKIPLLIKNTNRFISRLRV